VSTLALTVPDQRICPAYCCGHPFCIKGGRSASYIGTLFPLCQRDDRNRTCHCKSGRAHTVAISHHLPYFFRRKSNVPHFLIVCIGLGRTPCFSSLFLLLQSICGDDTSRGISIGHPDRRLSMSRCKASLELVPRPRNSLLGTLPTIVEFVL
jgi:hypothetical protein